MNENAVQEFLKGLRSAVGQLALYPREHPSCQAAFKRGRAAAENLADGGEMVVALKGYAFFLNGTLLAYTSLMFANLYQDLSEREIESISLVGLTTAEDYAQLALFVAGKIDDFPPGGSIRLNESHLVHEDDDSAFAELRFSYTGMVGTLRNLDHRVAREGTFEMAPVMGAVEDLIEQSMTSAGASLLLSTVKSHDEYTFYHSVNTCLMAVATGHYFGLNRKDLVPIGAGALLHDIGKVSVPTQVLNYPGRLNRDQWKEITMHPQDGAQAILAAGGPGHEIAATIALEHHARFDGLGYPRLSASPQPHLFSRLVSVSDVYDAITTRRSYRRAETPHRALQLLLQGAGGAFDPDIVKSFISLMGIFPPGSILRLMSGELVVISHHTGDLEELQAVTVRDAQGNDVEPEPRLVTIDEVVSQELAEAAGIEPAALLEESGVASQLLALTPFQRQEGVIERSGIDEQELRDQATRSLSSIHDRD